MVQLCDAPGRTGNVESYAFPCEAGVPGLDIAYGATRWVRRGVTEVSTQVRYEQHYTVLGTDTAYGAIYLPTRARHGVRTRGSPEPQQDQVPTPIPLSSPHVMHSPGTELVQDVTAISLNPAAHAVRH
eukprot:3750474-Rhodomonas_salina.2